MGGVPNVTLVNFHHQDELLLGQQQQPFCESVGGDGERKWQKAFLFTAIYVTRKIASRLFNKSCPGESAKLILQKSTNCDFPKGRLFIIAPPPPLPSHTHSMYVVSHGTSQQRELVNDAAGWLVVGCCPS